MEKDQQIRSNLGERIRQLREQQNLTQTQFSERISMNSKYFSEIELGKRNIGLRNLQRIADGLDVTLGEIFRFPVDKSLSEEAEELVALVTRLLQKGSKRKIRQVLAILRELL